MSRRLNVAAVGLSLVLATAACGSNDQDVAGVTGEPGSQAPPVSAGAVSGTLEVWAMGNEGALLGDFVAAFEEEYPEVTVNVTPVDWGQAVAKLQTAIGGRQTPDITQMGTDMMGQFASTGALEAVPANFAADAYFDSAWTTGAVDGVQYGVPWYVETRLLYYRTDLAEGAGMSDAPGSWEELKAAAQAMQEGGAEWGISLGTKNYQEYLPFVWSNGGAVVNEDGSFALDSAQAVEALTFYDSFFEEGLSPTAVPEGFDITPAFVSGTHPMFVSGPWHLGLIEEAGGADLEGKWAIAPHPGKDGPPGISFLGGSNLTVFKDSENKEAAWAFIEWMSRPETQVAWYQEATVLPAVEAAWDDAALADDENLSLFGEQLGSTAAPPAIPTWAEISSALNEQLERVTVGDVTPQDGASAMQQAADSIGTQ
jgi:multiple sugar transport system substrate-binding protein